MDNKYNNNNPADALGVYDISGLSGRHRMFEASAEEIAAAVKITAENKPKEWNPPQVMPENL